MSEFTRRYIFHNFWLKLVSLALATGLWLALARDPIAEVALEVPIVFRNVPDGLGIGYESLPKAQILLRGPQREVRAVRASDIHAEVDLAGVQPGERLFESSAVRVYKPHDLEVVEISPERFRILFSSLKESPSTETHK
jgi:hypothetical protein